MMMRSALVQDVYLYRFIILCIFPGLYIEKIRASELIYRCGDRSRRHRVEEFTSFHSTGFTLDCAYTRYQSGERGIEYR